MRTMIPGIIACRFPAVCAQFPPAISARRILRAATSMPTRAANTLHDTRGRPAESRTGAAQPASSSRNPGARDKPRQPREREVSASFRDLLHFVLRWISSTDCFYATCFVSEEIMRYSLPVVTVLVSSSLLNHFSHAAAAVGWRSDGTGHYPKANPVLEWSPTENVVWKTPLPEWGNSMPVLVSGKLFVNVEPDTLVC